MTRACFTGLKHMTMNHTINVSIAGVAFVLDSEGYELLKDYLVRIEVAYKDDPDGAEILSDIEARVSELILNRQSSDMIVSPELIREIIGQLGWPDGVTAQGPAGGAEIPENGADNAISRRLYRNPDGAKLGGVCNGLATYFRVDPTLVRLLFCSPLLILGVISVIPVVNALCGFFGSLIGVSFLLYLILWFAIPKARTPRQRLEMTGERITASSIRRNISADLNDARPSPRNERTASVFSELLYVTGRVLLFCIKAFLLLIGAVLGLVVLGLVVGLVAVLVGGAAVGFPFALAGGSLLIPVLIVLGIVLPLGIVVYLLLKLVFNLRSRRTTYDVVGAVRHLGSDPDLSGRLPREELRTHRGGVRPGRCRVVFQQDFRLARRRRSGRYSDPVRHRPRRDGHAGRLDAAGYRSDRVLYRIAGRRSGKSGTGDSPFRRNRTKKTIMCFDIPSMFAPGRIIMPVAVPGFVSGQVPTVKSPLSEGTACGETGTSGTRKPVRQSM